MIVSELIAALQQMPQDAICVVNQTPNGLANGSEIVKVEAVQSTHGKGDDDPQVKWVPAWGDWWDKDFDIPPQIVVNIESKGR